MSIAGPDLGRPEPRMKNGTGVARNFDWEGPKIEKSFEGSLVTFMGSYYRWRHWNDVI